MGNAPSEAMKVGLNQGLGASSEAELQELLSKLDQGDVSKIKAVLDDLRTPRDVPAGPPPAEAKPLEACAEAPAEEAKAAAPVEEKKEDEKPAEAAPAEEKAEKSEEMKEEEVKAVEDGLSEEQRKNVRNAFDLIDVDKSGSIEAAELKTIMKALNAEITDEEVDTIFKNMDLDGNKNIDFPEYCKMVAGALKSKSA